jgi:ATP-dependent RNA helicase DHX36
LKASLEAAHASAAYKLIQQQRDQLPIFSVKAELLRAVQDNQVVVVCGETGSGKSTQLPLYILQEMIRTNRGAECSVICTQPRRIAAITLAERVAYELSQEELVGYHIRLHARMTMQTRLLYVTTGILLQRLQSPGYLQSVSHIILDEVHERGVETDFLMAILKQQLLRCPHLRVVRIASYIALHCLAASCLCGTR